MPVRVPQVSECKLRSRQLKGVITKAEEAIEIVRAEETKLLATLADAQRQKARDTPIGSTREGETVKEGVLRARACVRVACAVCCVLLLGTGHSPCVLLLTARERRRSPLARNLLLSQERNGERLKEAKAELACLNKDAGSGVASTTSRTGYAFGR